MVSQSCRFGMNTKERSENSSHNKVGYARVSSVGQNLDSQIDTLEKTGCGRIFTDKITGSRMERSGWDELMRYVRPNDTIIITELSRMTRSLMHFLEISKVLEEKKIELISLRENIDTNTVTGRCFLSTMGAIYQMERGRVLRELQQDVLQLKLGVKVVVDQKHLLRN